MPNINQITATQLKLFQQTIELRDTMRNLHGENWPAKVKEISPFIRAKAKESQCSLLAASISLATQAKKDNRPMTSLLVLAVGCEITETSDQG